MIYSPPKQGRRTFWEVGVIIPHRSLEVSVEALSLAFDNFFCACETSGFSYAVFILCILRISKSNVFFNLYRSSLVRGSKIYKRLTDKGKCV